MAKEYIIDENTCPACNQRYDESSFRGNDTVKCGPCGYEKLIRTPLQKIRENIVVKNVLESGANLLIWAWLVYLIALLPLILYAILGPKSIAELRVEYPTASMIYIVVLIVCFVFLPIVLPFTAHEYRNLRKHGYSMEWIRVHYSKKRHVPFRHSLKWWENEIAKRKDIIG